MSRLVNKNHIKQTIAVLGAALLLIVLGAGAYALIDSKKASEVPATIAPLVTTEISLKEVPIPQPRQQDKIADLDAFISDHQINSSTLGFFIDSEDTWRIEFPTDDAEMVMNHWSFGDDWKQPPDPDLGFAYYVWYDDNMSESLQILNRLAGPYGMYKPVHSVRYACDGPFMQYMDRITESVTEDAVYTGCQTNGIDFLSQYEFTAAGLGYATGGDVCESWSKIYARRIDGEDWFFVYTSESIFHPEDSCYDIENGLQNNRNRSIDYIHERLQDPLVQQKMQHIDELVRTIRIVRVDA